MCFVPKRTGCDAAIIVHIMEDAHPPGDKYGLSFVLPCIDCSRRCASNQLLRAAALLPAWTRYAPCVVGVV